MTADDLLRRLHADGRDVPLPVPATVSPPESPPPVPAVPRERDVILVGAPDRDSTDEIAISRRHGWIALTPPALARAILRQSTDTVDAGDLATVLEEALAEPDWHAVFAPMLVEAFGNAFRLFSRIDGALTLHFLNGDEVAAFAQEHLRCDIGTFN